MRFCYGVRGWIIVRASVRRVRVRLRGKIRIRVTKWGIRNFLRSKTVVC